MLEAIWFPRPIYLLSGRFAFWDAAQHRQGRQEARQASPSRLSLAPQAMAPRNDNQKNTMVDIEPTTSNLIEDSIQDPLATTLRTIRGLGKRLLRNLQRRYGHERLYAAHHA